jgi:Protein of unknown function (DUF3999)
MTRRVVLVACTIVTSVAVGVAQQPPEFRYQRSVQLEGEGPHRLDVDVPLLAGTTPVTVVTSGDDRAIARGGFEDLRFYDSASREVPYLLVPPASAQPVWSNAHVLAVAATEKTSGFEADLGEVMLVDAIRLEGMGSPFLKRFVLEGSGDRTHWTLLVAEGTAFSLPAERLEHTTVTFDPGSYRYLRVTWDDRNSGRVSPPRAVSARRPHATTRPAPVLRTPLVAERRPSEPGRSRFRITLPAAHLPIVGLELTVAGGHLLREAKVVEARLRGDEAAPETIGAATLRRVVRDGLAADALRIPIRAPREARLDLVVGDGDNPPLDLTGVTAVFAELPWIYVEHGPGTLYARYGNTRLDAPRYDLEAARPQVPLARTNSALWGDVTAAAAPEPSAEALPMPDTGSALGAAEFRYSRDIAPGESGLVSVPLDAAVLAHSAGPRDRFADVRVLDSRGQQVPYLLERRDEPITIDVRVEVRALPDNLKYLERGSTAYVVQFPYRRLPHARLAFQTRARVFSRNVSIGTLVPPMPRHREPRLTTLSTHVWSHADAESAAPALTVDVPEHRGGDFVVLVDEGDNQRLPIEKATLLLPSYAVRLFRRADQPLRLMYGREDLGMPRYDLALLAPQVMGQVASEVSPGTEHASEAAGSVAAIVSPPVFWASLSLAVLVLLGIIVRLVRRDDAINQESRI